MISSLHNEKVKALMALMNKPRERKERGLFICEGPKVYLEAVKAGLVDSVYVSDSFRGRNDDIAPEAEVMSDDVFEKVSGTVTPQGVLTVTKMPEYTLEGLLSGKYKGDRPKDTLNLIILEDVRDPGNIGTIIRTAEGAGMDAVIMSQGCVDVFNPRVVRSTMGTIFRMPFIYVKDFQGTLDELQKAGTRLYAAYLPGSEDYRAVSNEDYAEKGVIIGNEANGLTRETAEKADVRVRIPMDGKVESLNAAVAASLLMYEIRRSRA